MLLAHALALSANHSFMPAEKFLLIRVSALGENSTREIDFNGHEYPRVNAKDC